MYVCLLDLIFFIICENGTCILIYLITNQNQARINFCRQVLYTALLVFHSLEKSETYLNIIRNLFDWILSETIWKESEL